MNIEWHKKSSPFGLLSALVLLLFLWLCILLQPRVKHTQGLAYALRSKVIVHNAFGVNSLGDDPIRKHHNVRQRRRHETQGFSPISVGVGENFDPEKRKAHAGKKKRHKHRKTGTVLCRECP